MVVLTAAEIEQYRAALAQVPSALRALTVIEDCEGDLEDAAISLAIQAGQEPSESDRWLEGVAKRWRAFLCQVERKDPLEAGVLADVIHALATQTDLPSVLATPVVLYVVKTGVDAFCKPLEEKL